MKLEWFKTPDSSLFIQIARHESWIYVKFWNSNVWRYETPEDIWQEFLHSDSKGSYFHKHIRNAYPGELYDRPC